MRKPKNPKDAADPQWLAYVRGIAEYHLEQRGLTRKRVEAFFDRKPKRKGA